MDPARSSIDVGVYPTSRKPISPSGCGSGAGNRRAVVKQRKGTIKRCGLITEVCDHAEPRTPQWTMNMGVQNAGGHATRKTPMNKLDTKERTSRGDPLTCRGRRQQWDYESRSMPRPWGRMATGSQLTQAVTLTRHQDMMIPGAASDM